MAVNFRYGTPRKAGSGGAIKRPVHRLLLPRMTFYLLLFRLRIAGKTVERREAAVVFSKVSLKIRGTPRSVGGRSIAVEERDRERETLVKAALLIGSSLPRNCCHSPTRNRARRKYGLMSSPLSFSFPSFPPSLSLFFSLFHSLAHSFFLFFSAL